MFVNPKCVATRKEQDWELQHPIIFKKTNTATIVTQKLYLVAEKQYVENLVQKFASSAENKLSDDAFGKLVTDFGAGIESYNAKRLFRY